MNSNLNKIRHPLVANSFYLYSAHFADYLLSFLILPFIARKLGPQSLGEVALAQTFGIFCLLFMEFGFSLTATRKVATLRENKEKLRSFIEQSFSFKIASMPILFLVAVIIAWGFPVFQQKPHFIFLVLLGSIFQGVAPTWYFQGIERLSQVAYSKILFRIIGFGFIFSLVKTPDDGWLVLAGYSTTSVLICVYLFKKMKNEIGKIHFVKLRDSLALWREYKWGLFITTIPAVYHNVAAFSLGLIVEPIQLGLLFGASKIHRAMNTLYGPLGQAIYPRLISTNSKNSNQTKRLLRKLFYIMLGMGFVFTGILLGFTERIIIILLGEQYLDARPILQLFALILPLTAITHVMGRQWMLIKAQDKHYGIILGVASIMGTFFVWLGINTYNLSVLPLSMILFESVVIGLILTRNLFK